jgi:phage gpG-like protein
MAKNKLDMSKVVQRWNKAKNQLPKLLTNVSKNMFVDSWKRQGWDGEKWKEVQRRTPGTKAYKNATKSARTRAILVQSGTLRRSIVINSQTFSRMTISTNVPYAEVHNEGGTINRAGYKGVCITERLRQICEHETPLRDLQARTEGKNLIGQHMQWKSM